MTISHHPEPESLMSCSAGSMPEAFAAVMASHIEVCAVCRETLAVMERIGVSLFEQLSPVGVSRPAPVHALRAAEAGEPATGGLDAASAAGDMPPALAAVLGSNLDTLPWKKIAPGLAQVQIPLSSSSRGELRLIKVAPGQAFPVHGHKGSEMTLVLRGSYRDALGQYLPGDVSDLCDDAEHAPVADAVEGCICLLASEARVKFKSPFARLIQPLVGI